MMISNTVVSKYTRASTWVLVIYLSLALSGCSFRPAELTPEEARLLQTRELSATPEEVANVALFLASNEASYVTGQIIHVKGGP